MTNFAMRFGYLSRCDAVYWSMAENGMCGRRAAIWSDHPELLWRNKNEGFRDFLLVNRDFSPDDGSTLT
jgi:hypothetical protein